MFVRLFLVFGIALCLAAHADENPLFTEIQGNGVYQTADYSKAEVTRNAIASRWEKGGMKAMAFDVNKALGGILWIASTNLRRHGYRQEARDLDAGWKQMDGEVIRLAEAYSQRRITDYAPLSTYLAAAYFVLEEKLGYDICHALKLDFILSFNYGIKYIFTMPCLNGDKEFFYHFVHDDPTIFHPYEGLAPATSYVLTAITCDVATFGAGIFWLCGPAAMLVQLGFDRVVGPALSPKIYNMVCTKGDF